MRTEDQLWPDRSYTEDEIRDLVMEHRIPFSVWLKSSSVVERPELGGFPHVTPERYWEDDLQATVDMRWEVEERRRLELIYTDKIELLERKASSLKTGQTVAVWAFFAQLLFWVLMILTT